MKCLQSILLVNFLLVSSQSQDHPRYELIHSEDRHETAQTGMIILRCRTLPSAVEVDVDNVVFWLNRRSACDPDLRERGDIKVVIGDDHRSIIVNVTRRFEGNYSCGLRVDNANVIESSKVTLVCKY